MRRVDDVLLEDPIVRAALRAHGIEPTDLPWSEGENGGHEIVRHATRTLPAITIDDEGNVKVRWWHPENMVDYSIDREGGIVTIERLLLPESSVDGLAGRTLSDAFSFPGADAMRILVAVNSSPFPGVPSDVRMTVEPIRETAA